MLSHYRFSIAARKRQLSRAQSRQEAGMTIMILSNRLFHMVLLFITLILAAVWSYPPSYAENQLGGTSNHPIIDSRMTESEAFDGLDPKCPKEIRERQKVVKLKYYSSDGKIHQGQLVIDAALKDDIKKVFALALKEHFPVGTEQP